MKTDIVMDEFQLYIVNGICDYGIAGKTWGTTLSNGIIQGATFDNVHITNSTSLTFHKCLCRTDAGRNGFNLIGWYGNLIGCSADTCGDYAYYVIRSILDFGAMWHRG